MFQFHSGSIQTPTAFGFSFDSTCFNSTLVRFKLGKAGADRHFSLWVSIPLWFDSNKSETIRRGFLLGFQFHSGSIQTQHPPEQVEAEPGFNSTLVRFKRSFFSLSCASFVRFQFHSGSIQTVENFCLYHDEGKFQFHSGSIQTSRDFLYVKSLCLVSIPLWFDSNSNRS